MNQPALFTTSCQHEITRRIDNSTLRCAECGAWIRSAWVAEQRKQAGINQVLENEDAEWKTRALACAYRVARKMPEFTVEDLRDEWLKDGLGNPHHENCIGGIFHRIKGEKIAVPTDRTCKATHVEGHGRSIRIWRSCLV